jgi:rubredoxin
MDFVTLQTFDNYFYANITLNKLKNEGVECYLKDEYTVTIDPMLSNAIGGIKLAVLDTDVEKATVFLKQFHDEYMKSVECPDCKLNEIILENKTSPKNIFSGFLTFFFGSFPIAVDKIYKCQVCGYESKTMPLGIMEEE